MNWLNLRVSIVRSPDYVGCEPVQRATWFNVLIYSVEQENAGRIVGAKQWKCRQWQQTCGVTLAEVVAADPLLSWDGDDLVVWSYPADKEEEVRVKREAGKTGGAAKSKLKAAAARENGSKGGRPPEAEEVTEPKQEPKQPAPDNPSRNPTEGKGREGKENGKERNLFCAEPEEPASAPPVMEFPCVGVPNLWPLTPDKLGEWEEAYPDMDVEAACTAARLWCLNNRPKRKTASGMPRFLNGWLKKAQNTGEHRIEGERLAYFKSPNPDACRPLGDVIRDDFNNSLGKRAEAGDAAAANLLSRINQTP